MATDRYEWSFPAGGRDPGWSVVVVWHDRAPCSGRTAELARGEHVALGRGHLWLGPGALDHAGLSEAHVALEAREDGVLVTDTSRNGTLVDGVLLRAGTDRSAAVATNGSVVSLPACHLVVRRGKVGEVATLGALRSRGGWLRDLAHFATTWDPPTGLVLLGETGTGKSSAAKAVHTARAGEAPFVRVQLGALLAGTWQSELFGWVKGAWTGAHADGTGAFFAASGGTLFLDELGYVPATVQQGLLTSLDADRRYRRVGEPGREHTLRAHLVAAADRDLRDGFLAPLWHRLAGRVVEIPPLRERREDILDLVGIRRLTSRSARKLLLHPWPGNVRQLERVAGQLRASTSADDALDDALAAEVAPASDVEPPARARTKRAEPASSAEIDQRILAGATQRTLAAEWGVDESTVSRWRNRRQ